MIDLVLVPIASLFFVLMTIGLCFLVSVLCTFFRDLEQIVKLVLMASLFLSPVFYSLDFIGENIAKALYFNPLTIPIEFCRNNLSSHEVVMNIKSLALYSALSVALAFCSYRVFRRTSQFFHHFI